MISLEEYRNVINLEYTPRKGEIISEKEKSALCDDLLAILLEERNRIAAFSYPYRTKRDLIWQYLNERPPAPVTEEFLEKQDRLFTSETLERGIVPLEDLEFSGGIALWQGDITLLAADAVVNAANSALLGCFIPHHTCIDNVIHSRAGVQMRLDCSKIMGLQGEQEPPGCAKITLAYNLSSKYVIHTVGPMVGLSVTDEDRRILRSCYISCLNLAKEMGLTSIAFCCIATGIFGFPSDEAAAIAVGAVRSWLLKNRYPISIVFDVFLDKDRKIYEEILRC